MFGVGSISSVYIPGIAHAELHHALVRACHCRDFRELRTQFLWRADRLSENCCIGCENKLFSGNSSQQRPVTLPEVPLGYRIVFSFDPADMKTMSNEALDKSLEHSSSSMVVAHQRPISSNDIFKRQLSDRERRFSAPPTERKGGMRDSVGSIDYLSEGPGR